MAINWDNYRWFNGDADFNGRDPDSALLDVLDEARDLAGIPFIITSGVRTPEQNADAGGVPDSAHLTGLAADIRVRNSHERGLILSSLYLCGAHRVGVGKTFIHVDVDESKPPDVCWLYD